MSIDKNILEQICSRLVNAYHPETIYLFGSNAWGVPNADSDIDLLVVVSDDAPDENKKGLKGQYALSDMRIAKDLLVITQSGFIKRAEHPSTLYHKIKNEAIKLYESA